MKIIKIDEGIFQYCFNDDEEADMGYNIFALIAKDKALIIDTAYTIQAQQVRDDLEKKGIRPEKVIISHFHPDHAGGSSIFSDCEIIGSKFYKVNINNCRRWAPEYKYLEPNVLVKNDDRMEFGPFKLRFLYTPGHSNCSISTIINDKFIHVGDLIMASNTGKPLLPIVTLNGSFFEHISSLELVKELHIKNLLLAHGSPMVDQEKIDTAIDDRIYYLKNVQQSKGNLSAEDCLKEPLEYYGCTKWHDINCKYFKRFF
ncbi:MBL fold metallo-hydrolase [Wukongibacter baidiensis]|uniref:MBL fold metallo-hydrolase n=1 Tax=Wukongibacter baidiensis TaxID=1723361 RepID=UPI003D7FF5DA